jgi:hypothetical protein
MAAPDSGDRMKKTLSVIALTTFLAFPALAAPYIVVLKDGTQYAAKQKWTMKDGKAIVRLEDGRTLQLDPALIDVAKSEAATKVGMVNAVSMDMGDGRPAAPPKPKQSLGDQIRLRPRASQTPTPATPEPSLSATPAAGALPNVVVDKFQRAFENVGIFEHKVEATSSTALKATLTVDTEERVFNALSATSFLMVRDAGTDGVRIELVELYMKTTTGGAAGRFKMTRADAEAINARSISQQDYFVRHVIY